MGQDLWTAVAPRPTGSDGAGPARPEQERSRDRCRAGASPGAGGQPIEHREQGVIEAVGVVPEVPDALEHDRPAIADGIEGGGPAVPIDGAEPGGLVGVLPAVVVVDVGGAGRVPAARVSAAGRGRDVGVAGVEGQGELGAVQLRPAARPGRPSGCRDGRPAACSRRRGARRSRAAWSASSSRPRARASRRAPNCSGSERPPGWTTRQVPPASCEPVDARLQVVDRRRAGVRVGSAQVDAGGPDRLAAPAAVGAVDREAGVGDLVRGGPRVGLGPPVGQDFQDRRAEAAGQGQVRGQVDAAKP